eukprot:2767559-Pyramimonas_sp.AAC.1
MVEELKFDQHPMDPCVFLLRGPVAQENAHLVARDRVSVIPHATGPERAQLKRAGHAVRHPRSAR